MLGAFEGIDGSGKSGLSEAVANEIGALRIKFPDYSTPTGKLIKDHLEHSPDEVVGDPASDHRNALIFQSLNVANRMEKMSWLLQGERRQRHVVLDRYWQSGWVYGQLDGLNREWLFDVHKTMAQPHVSFLLDIPPEVAIERCKGRDGEGKAERYERLDTMRKARDLYLELWENCQKFDARSEWVILDGTQTPAELLSQALRALRCGLG
jgi:dTMP kinase